MRGRPPSTSCDLSTGDCGSALFLSYATAIPGCEWAHGIANALLGRAMRSDDADSMQPGLLAGVAGVAFVAEHLVGEPVDELVMRAGALLRAEELTGDVVFGAAGVLLLGLASESLHAPALRATCIDRILALTSASYVDRQVGVAHGIAGVIAALSQALPKASAGDRDRITAWLELAARGFTSKWDERRRTTPSPRARGWCYGDLGIVAALAVAASSGSPVICRLAAGGIATAADICLEHPEPQCASLCHGSAGIGLLYHRLWNASGEDRFLHASRQWYRHALYARTLPGVHPLEGLLIGAPGIGLALLAAATDVEPIWDAMFLMSPING
jgi:lantibiotic biosynthesis protein